MGEILSRRFSAVDSAEFPLRCDRNECPSLAGPCVPYCSGSLPVGVRLLSPAREVLRSRRGLLASARGRQTVAVRRGGVHSGCLTSRFGGMTFNSCARLRRAMRLRIPIGLLLGRKRGQYASELAAHPYRSLCAEAQVHTGHLERGAPARTSGCGRATLPAASPPASRDSAGVGASSPRRRLDHRRRGSERAMSPVQAATMSRKFRPARSSISRIQTSGSNFTSRAR